MNGLAWIEEERHEGTWTTEHLSLFLFTSGIFCNVLSDSKVYFSLLHKLSSTSSDGVRSGNLNVSCGTFWGRCMHGFSRDLVFIPLPLCRQFLSIRGSFGAGKGLSRWGWARLGRWLGSSLSMVVWNGMVS